MGNHNIPHTTTPSHEEDAKRTVEKTVKVLFVGDSLFHDVMCFLNPLCLEEGISIHASSITSKNPVEARKMIRFLDRRAFDFVFYSPMTFDFTPEFSKLMQTSSAALGKNELRRIVDKIMSALDSILDRLAGHFECPIFVHNTAALCRNDGTFKEKLRTQATRRIRQEARTLLNPRVLDSIQRANETTFDHVHLTDEESLLEKFPEEDLSTSIVVKRSKPTTPIGKVLADFYRSILVGHVYQSSS